MVFAKYLYVIILANRSGRLKDFIDKISFKRQTNKVVKSTNSLQTNVIIQKRIIFFGFLLVVGMAIILARLFYLQVYSNDDYIAKLDNYTRRYQTITTPRGEMVDRNGKTIVSNKIIKSIIYYPPNFHTATDKWELAQKFAKNFKTDELIANQSDLTDLYLFLHLDLIEERLSESELADIASGKYTNEQYSYLIKGKVTDEDRQSLLDFDIKAYKVYQQMTKASSGGMKVIISDVSNQEIAYLAEHNLDYPGFDSFSNWDRQYLDSYGLRGVLGNVSTEAQGLSSEMIDYYLAKDYSRDERMGLSGLEEYYEEVISGDKTIQDVVYTNEGYADPVEIQKGSKGNDLVLTVDLDLQKEVEKIVKDTMLAEKSNPNRKYFDTAYVLVSNPKNGDILASVAFKTDKDGELYNNAVYNHLDAAIPGSTIKGATVYLGLSEGKMDPLEQIMDTPIKIAGTPLKRSYQNLVSTNAITALAQSSNVYMFHVAMRVAEANYAYDQPLYGIDEQDFIKLKNNYSRFGLGTLTGIDMPNEAPGYEGKNFVSGFLLDYAMGQYDTYTPMQLITYINTIANDGVRVKPRYVKEAKDPITGLTVYENEVETVSILEDQKSLKYVQEGFRACVTEGLCQGTLNNDRYTVAAKTGTAEDTFTNDDGEVVSNAPHSLLVGYAPYEAPEVSIACVTPNSMNDKVLSNICQPITSKIFDYYFNNK